MGMMMEWRIQMMNEILIREVSGSERRLRNIYDEIQRLENEKLYLNGRIDAINMVLGRIQNDR